MNTSAKLNQNNRSQQQILLSSLLACRINKSLDFRIVEFTASVHYSSVNAIDTQHVYDFLICPCHVSDITVSGSSIDRCVTSGKPTQKAVTFSSPLFGLEDVTGSNSYRNSHLCLKTSQGERSSAGSCHQSTQR